MELISNFKFFLLICLSMKFSFCVCMRVDSRTKRSERPDEKLDQRELERIFYTTVRKDLVYDFANIETETIDPITKIITLTFKSETKTWTVHLKQQNKKESVISTSTKIMRVRTVKENSYTYRDDIFARDVFNSSYIYEDKNQMATFIVHKRGDDNFYDGIFGEGAAMRIVRSAPPRFTLHYGSGSHFIFEAGVYSDINIGEELKPAEISKTASNTLDVLYPKLIVVVDSNLYRIVGGRPLGCTIYLAIFWNAVDLRYRKFTNPRVDVKITGIIVAEDYQALRYVFESRTGVRNTGNKIRGSRIVIGSSVYFFNDFPKHKTFKNYDAIMTMTSMSDEDGKAGEANVGQICSNAENTAYFNERGGFRGILTAAHELGHMLDMKHDADFGCPEQPNDKTSTIMAKMANFNVNKYVWSQCSIDALEDFAGMAKARCLEKSSRTRH